MGKPNSKMPSPPDPNFLHALQKKDQAEQAKAQANYSQIGVETPFAKVSYEGEVGSPDRIKKVSLSGDAKAQMDQDYQLRDHIHHHLKKRMDLMSNAPDAFQDLPEIKPMSPQALTAREVEILNQGKAQLNRDFKHQFKRLDSLLGQRGFSTDSKAYQKSMKNLNKSHQEAVSQLASQAGHLAKAEAKDQLNQALTLRNQKIGEALAKQNQEHKAIGGLMSHLKAINPDHYTHYLSHLEQPSANIGFRPINFAQNYREQLAYAQQQEKQQQNFMGGLFSLAKAIF